MNYSDLKYFARHLLECCQGEPAPRTGHDWYYFLHIPKTAGTTFRFSLYDYFPQRSIYPNFFELIIRQKGRYLPFEKFRQHQDRLFPAHKTLLLGHYSIRPWQLFDKDHQPRTLTIFRNPEKRMISSIKFHQEKNREYFGLSTDEVIEKHGAMEGSRQARALGYQAQRGNLQEALERVEALDFVGLSEAFDRSLAACNKRFGWDLKNRGARNIARGQSSLTPDQLKKIKACCEPDWQIYERAQRRFEALCKELAV